MLNMTTISNSASVHDIQALIVELEMYYETLLEENRAICSIVAEDIFNVQNKKHQAFAKFGQYQEMIEKIFSIFDNPKSSDIPEDIIEIAEKKLTNLLQKIQILGKSNQQLLNSLKKHTDSLLNKIAPEQQEVTYDSIKKRRT